jgi:hypothetical protein
MANVLRIVDDMVWTDLGDEVVILKLDSGIHFGLGQVGARIWRLIADGRTPQEVLQTITAEYETTGEPVEQDIEEPISELSRGAVSASGAGWVSLLELERLTAPTTILPSRIVND